MFRFAIIPVCGLLFCAAPLQADEPGGYTSLYDGNDLSHWTTQGNWVSEADGVLTIRPRDGETDWKRYDAYLTSKKKYTDYEIVLEYRFAKDGNSGFHFLIQDPADPVNTGLEIQIKDSHGKAEDKIGPHDSGGIIRTSAPKVNAMKPAGKWNELKVRLKDGQLKAWLNGKLIQDLDLAGHDHSRKFAAAGSGYISLQDHGLEVSFRKLRIKELKK